MPGDGKSRMAYFAQDDVLHLAISDEPEARSIKLILRNPCHLWISVFHSACNTLTSTCISLLIRL